MPITTKTRGHNGYVTARFTDSGFIDLHHSDATIGANCAGETVSSMNIVGYVINTGANCSFTIARGANTVLYLTGQDNMNLQQDNMIIDNLPGEATANLVVTKVGGGTGVVLLKLHKQSRQSGID